MRLTGGRFKGRELRTVQGRPGQGYRPATSKVRQAVFSMLEARGVDWEGARVLDLFAGSGSLGFEALSRGAEHVLFVEKSKPAARTITDNARALALDKGQVQVMARDLFGMLRQGLPSGSKPYDIIFIDPPYGKDLLEPALTTMLEGNWCGDEAIILAEVEAGLDLDPESLHSRLELLRDKSYGQTRIVVWLLNEI